jgi:hypothetical protein
VIVGLLLIVPNSCHHKTLETTLKEQPKPSVKADLSPQPTQPAAQTLVNGTANMTDIVATFMDDNFALVWLIITAPMMFWVLNRVFRRTIY